mmetsp:Transcript_34421/g.77622  ORF Transcript_34421/g.77622 Transcript_34421/m.77622 type:complete len:204 (+) Transcript_34421:530-1141(+)
MPIQRISLLSFACGRRTGFPCPRICCQHLPNLLSPDLEVVQSYSMLLRSPSSKLCGSSAQPAAHLWEGLYRRILSARRELSQGRNTPSRCHAHTMSARCLQPVERSDSDLLALQVPSGRRQSMLDDCHRRTFSSHLYCSDSFGGFLRCSQTARPGLLHSLTSKLQESFPHAERSNERRRTSASRISSHRQHVDVSCLSSPAAY